MEVSKQLVEDRVPHFLYSDFSGAPLGTEGVGMIEDGCDAALFGEGRERDSELLQFVRTQPRKIRSRTSAVRESH